MADVLNDRIVVGVVFGERGMRLVWFDWQGRRRRIERVTYAWKAWNGALPMRYFTVSDGAGAYELAFNTRDLDWRLTKVRLEEERSA